MTDSKSPLSRLDNTTEAWLQKIEETHGPGAARISRRMAAWAAYEALALRFYRATQQGQPPPNITDGVERSYAWVMGQSVADVNEAVAANDRFWEYAHRAMVSRIHSAVHTYQRDRDELGLPLESSPDEISTAGYRALCARGGWAKPAWACEP